MNYFQMKNDLPRQLNLSENASETYLEKILCLSKSETQEGLKFSSEIYIGVGSAVSLVILAINMSILMFLVLNRKAKYSPMCIYMIFLAAFNLLKLVEFYLSALIKLRIVINYQDILTKNSMCKWVNFLLYFTGHVSVYLVLLIQYQQYLVKLLYGKDFSRSKYLYYNALMANNYALTYFICIGLVFLFFLVDEFYLYDNYFETLIYCPLTKVYTCVLNDEFKLLHMFKFNSMLYQHLHTLLFNVIPLILIFLINGLIIYRIYRIDKKRRLELDPQMAHQNRNMLSINSTDELESTWAPGEIRYRVEMRSESDIYVSFHNKKVYWSILVSFLQILNTFPVNMVKYFAEWNTKHLKKIVDEDASGSSHSILNLPSRLTGDQSSISQAHVYHFYMLYGLLDMFNFTLFLLFHLTSSRLLFKEFKTAVMRAIIRRD
jgi:hypothetical protein